MDGPGIRSKQYGFKGNAHHQGVGSATTSTSLGKRKGMKASASGSGGGKKQPPKLVFIGNPLRVKTTEACFRAPVQELTDCHMDLEKYRGAATLINIDDRSGGSLVEPHRQASGLLLPSLVSTPSLDAASGSTTGAAHVSSMPAYGDDSFAPQLIDNIFSTFSPPMFL